jgi:secreted trypsin-like serine protease
VTPRHVLTASHCFLDQNGQPITDAGGRIRAVDVAIVEDSEDGAKSVIVRGTNVFIHPKAEYGDAAVLYDLAVVELERSVDAPTLPIVVSQQSAPNFKAQVYGYGLDEDNRLGELKSGEMWVDVVTQFLVYTQFEGAGATICSGDSGGPLTREVDGAGIGIIGVNSITLSEGGTCGENYEAGDPPVIGGFVNVQDPEALNWIQSRAPGTRTI